jgi:hypothetical protein
MHATTVRPLVLIFAVACAKNPAPDTQIPKSIPTAQSNRPAESTSSHIAEAQAHAVPQPEIERLFLRTVDQELRGITIEPAANADIRNMLHLASVRLAEAHADESTVRQATASVQRFGEVARTKAKHEVFTTSTDTTGTTGTTGTPATTTGPTATDTTGTMSVEENIIDVDVVRATRLSICPLYPIC